MNQSKKQQQIHCNTLQVVFEGKNGHTCLLPLVGIFWVQKGLILVFLNWEHCKDCYFQPWTFVYLKFHNLSLFSKRKFVITENNPSATCRWLGHKFHMLTHIRDYVHQSRRFCHHRQMLNFFVEAGAWKPHKTRSFAEGHIFPLMICKCSYHLAQNLQTCKCTYFYN